MVVVGTSVSMDAVASRDSPLTHAAGAAGCVPSRDASVSTGRRGRFGGFPAAAGLVPGFLFFAAGKNEKTCRC